MTCFTCGSRPSADPDGVLCMSCLVEELASLARRREELFREELRNTPPALCFLLNVMVDRGWPERAVSAAQHALSRPEPAVPAVFADLAEAS